MGDPFPHLHPPLKNIGVGKAEEPISRRVALTHLSYMDRERERTEGAREIREIENRIIVSVMVIHEQGGGHYLSLSLSLYSREIQIEKLFF